MWRQTGIFISIFILLQAEADSYRFMGCYKDNSDAAHLMSGDHLDFKGTLTPDKCVAHCKTKGFAYAGVQHGFRCFCSHERPPFERFAELSECNMKCEGITTKTCGGNLRLGVYDIHNKRVNYVQANYMGCYADEGTSRRALRERVSPDRNEMTPEFCVGYCYIYGYRYAGVQNQRQCFCGDVIKGERANEEECDLDCAGDPRLLCGGAWKNNIYHTSISNESEDGRLIGCFRDSQDLRLLSGQVFYFKENNSPRRCLNICLQLGFKYAGVEYQHECYCGNKRPDKRKETAENECLAQCPKSNLRACGGTWRIAVYSTDSQEVYSTAPVHQQPTFVIVPENQLPAFQKQIQGTYSQTVETLPIPQNQNPPQSPKTTRRPAAQRQPMDTADFCAQSKTEFGGKKICKGELIFKEKFDSLTPGLWKHEIFIPDAPDYEFVVFDDNRTNIFNQNGRLHIKPSVFDDEFVRCGKLRLEKCTGDKYKKECHRDGRTYSLIPPVRSARITTKESFFFKYGKVVVNAKLPGGDWVLPEIWLEPKKRVYGSNYRSGRISIAFSRGNPNLYYIGFSIGSGLLKQAILMGTDDNDIKDMKVYKEKRTGSWFKDFHNYTLIWTPDNISFQVDDEEIKDLILPNSGKLFKLLDFDENKANIWEQGTPIAPFDQEFYFSLGVSVGGFRFFPDNCTTNGGHRKPWNDRSVKALYDFWNDRENWLSTWKDNNELIVDDISVYALE